MSVVFVHADTGAVFITDGSGAVSLSAGVPIDDFTVLQATLTAGLVSDGDTFPAPGIGFPAQSLLAALVTDADAVHASTMGAGLVPALVTDADTVFATTLVYMPALRPALFASDDAFFAASVAAGARTLTPALITDSDTFPSLFVTLVGLPGGPLQKLKPPPKLQDADIIFAFTSSRMSALVVDQDLIRAPVITALSNVQPGFVLDSDTIITGTDIGYSNRLPPGLVTDDEVVFGALMTMVLEPELKLDGDGILASDVGWQVIAGFTADVDEVYGVDAYAFYPLYPEVWVDEETIDTYPFYVQQISGGVPVPPREGVLTGSIKRSPQLTGSITKARKVA